MRLSVRVKAVDDPTAMRCLIAVGGETVYPIGKSPQFRFASNCTYNEYRKLMRQAKAKDNSIS
ncbi:hypothetical protein FPZ44_08035 [Paenibacillus agilis]|uniref:Uncharacterized protein n=1 Tax=Paenibacillus agilis TaxID=3020863 RepID=A0A559IZG0_9BACL|nr:hypothetical protein FPZ44_08035 [Paenibacillus agilis]